MGDSVYTGRGLFRSTTPRLERVRVAARTLSQPDVVALSPVLTLPIVDRVTPEGKVRVYETRDAGASWTARGDGLPQDDAYLTVYRQAFGSAGADGDLELYFGATSGDVFGSADAGASWFSVHERLAPVTSVRVA